MGDGLKRASDYANRILAPILCDVKRIGTIKVSDRYLITSQGGMAKLSRSQLPQWVDEFARRHQLTYRHDDKREIYTFESQVRKLNDQAQPK